MTGNHPSYVLSIPHQIESAGVDWITLSQRREKRSESLYEQGTALVLAEEELGHERSVWRWQGYHGLKCGGASVGIRADGYILQLRAEVARERWLEVIPCADNVSRLDLQVTALLEQSQTHLIRAEYARLKRVARGKGRPSESTLIDSQRRGCSLYLGRRVSDKYARLYDKGAEEKTAPLGTCFRWEVELKRQVAKSAALELSKCESHQTQAAAMVCRHFASKRIKTPRLNMQGLRTPRASQGNATSDRRAYIMMIVAPMVSKLLKHHTRGEIIRWLGLDDETMERRKTFGVD